MRSCFIFLGAVGEHDLFLRHIIWRTNIVPSIDRRIEHLLERTAHIHQARTARPKQPFMRIRSQEIDMLNRGLERAECLDGIQSKKDVPFSQKFADALKVYPVTADKMTSRQ